MSQAPAIGSLAALFPTAGAGLGAENAGGIGSLFGQLLQGGLQGTEGAAPAGADLAALFPEAAGLLQGFNLQNPFGTQTQLGETALTVQGSETQAEAIQVLTQTITVLYQQITTQGFSFTQPEGRTAELAQALTAMGVPAEEALSMAKSIDTMLALLDKELEKMKGESTPETMASMAAVLMAGMLTQSRQQATLTQTATQTTTLTVQVSMSETRSIMVRFPANANTARDAVLGAAQANQNAAMVAVQAPAVPQISVQVGEGEGASVQVALNPQNSTEVPTEALNTAAIPQPTVQKIDAPKDITGRLMYVLKEAPTGAATVQAVAPTQEAETPATPRSATTPVLDIKPEFTEAAPTQPTDAQALQSAAPALHRFAEQMKQAQQNQVAQQVVVAVQPMLKSGEGGAVRMTINPPELGRIEIHLKIEAGQVSGAISANEPATVEHLARELPALKQAFADAGLKLGEQGLNLMLNQNPQDNQRQPNPFAEQPQNQNRNTPRFDDEGDDVLPTAVAANTPARWVAPERLLDRDI